jgi:hypothetical protein
MNNQLNGQKNNLFFPTTPKVKLCYLKIFHMVYNVIKSIKLTWPDINIKENLHQLHHLMCYFLFL